jgi:pimeloyl-ACP methyl ester carboxylesterase
MPFVDLPSSPLAPGVAPVRIRYRDTGSGWPIVILHGGWGGEIYPFDRQIAALASEYRVVVPDRSGYGGSPAITDLPPAFHDHAAAETRAVIDALGLSRPILWGHSDGAIVALLLGLNDPGRIAGVILEAAHFYRWKPRSRAFFEGIAADPAAVGSRAAAVLAADHGERWREIVTLHSRAWLRLANEGRPAPADFYGNRLGDLPVPFLLVHGAQDPRTEPGELEAMRAALERTPMRRSDPVGPESANPAQVQRSFAIFDDAGHSPHSERATADDVTRAALAFIRAVTEPSDPADPAGRARS